MRTLPHHLIRLTIALTLIFIFAISASAQEPNLIGAFFVKGKVGLKWIKVSGAASYNIYRQAAGEEFANIGSTEKTNHFDTDLVGGSVYTYKIGAVVDGNEVFGSTKSVTIPATLATFSAPKDLASREDSRGDGIMLKWDKVRGAIAYNVMRSTTAGSGYEVVGNATVHKYADKDNLVKGTTYYYVVTAMNDEFEESGNSNETSMKFGLSDEELKALADAEQTIFLDSIDIELAFKVSEVDGKPLSYPSAVAINTKGDIYITDTNNKRIVCTDSKGNPKFAFGKMMYEDQKDNPPDGAFLNPFTITTDNQDNVYVSDIITNDIQVFTAEGKFIRRIRVATTEEQKAFRSNGLDIFDNGNILTSDVGNHRMLILDPTGNIVKEIPGSEKMLAHYPNGVEIIDENSFVFTNPVMGMVVVADFDGNQKMSFGGQGIAVGMFGRAVAVTIGDDGLIWVSDAMGSNIQAYTMEGEVKLAIGNDKIDDIELKLTKPRGIIVRNGMIYVVNAKAGQLQVFNYKVTKVEK